MSDSTLNVTQALDSPEKHLKIVDNLDDTYSVATSVRDSALPTGAATAAAQATALTELQLKPDLSESHFGFAAASGRITGYSVVNKFGEAPSGIQTTATDIWSRADATPTQQIWLAPTSAKIHAIVSSSDLDGKTAAPNSVGARTLRVYGLKTWDLAETSEDITLDGTTPVNTAQSYVIIHRMKVLTMGTSGPNVGTITATAADIGTVTAVILPGDGQTEMAIYGVPSTQTAYLFRWSASIDKASGVAVSCDFRLRVNENPNVQTTGFLRKMDMSVQSTGANAVNRDFHLPIKLSGPCIIKVQGIASSNDVDASAQFDLLLVNN